MLGIFYLDAEVCDGESVGPRNNQKGYQAGVDKQVVHWDQVDMQPSSLPLRPWSLKRVNQISRTTIPHISRKRPPGLSATVSFRLGGAPSTRCNEVRSEGYAKGGSLQERSGGRLVLEEVCEGFRSMTLSDLTLVNGRDGYSLSCSSGKPTPKARRLGSHGCGRKKMVGA